jgi:hypothetical protein
MSPKKINILNEIKQSGAGFKTPEGYFDGLEHRLYKNTRGNKIKDNLGFDDKKDPLNSETSLLENVKKDAGFKVPDSYFDALENRIERPFKPKVIGLKERGIRLLSLSIAASILLFFGIKYYNVEPNTVDQMVLEDSEIENWIETDLISFDSYEIAEVYRDVDLEQTMYIDQEIDDYFDYMDIEELLIEN